MDPDLRESLRAFLSDGAVVEIVGKDAQRQLLDLIAEPPLAPHVVHTENAILEEDQQVKTFDPDRGKGKPDGTETGSPFWLIKSRHRQYLGPTSCPDCGRGLTSRGFDMICPRLPRSTSIKGDHEGCIVACGLVA
jgi:hypothetical protein